ncbi:uncharacterized protein LDX57_012685 [Aspergillus melleus]|uniref:uncharacterized protein n=1 Tax=Aspergillus melleus TaxID=138277 RepID=UPI001E8CE6AF|nr:uncharacterized protein LDX57_012685 [Aspergillus melleus]KAH8435056.1 hypothetical protein LDX57_012685 [Aspergillus melleus]
MTVTTIVNDGSYAVKPPFVSIHTARKDHGTEFEALGKDLTEAMSAYVGYLRDEKLPLPSLDPSAVDSPAVRHADGVASKEKIIELAQEICARTMDPKMNLLISSLQFHFCSCLQTVLHLRVHEHIPKNGNVAARDLAAAVGAEEALLTRIMRVLTNKYIFAEPEPGYYAHTAMSWSMRGPNEYHLLAHRLDEPFRASSRQADALAAGGYREPRSNDSFGFHLAFNTQRNFWDYLATEDLGRRQRFARAMQAVNLNTLDVIPEMYAFNKLIADGGVIVDVGGGLGQVARKIQAYYPDSGLRFIVQDGFAPVDSTTRDVSGVEIQRHDFFGPQPVKGAAAYFFRHIFHDWPDSTCVHILKQTAEAMDANRSRILICDQIVDEASPSVPSMLYDIDMMTLFGGKERTLRQWDALLKAADERLYVSRIAKKMTTTIIEVCVGDTR